MATPNVPIVNAGAYYINGLRLSNDATSATTLDEIVICSAGACRDSTNENDIIATASMSADITESGAGGLDTGTVATDTFYAVHVIGDSTLYNDPALMFSTSATAPSLPGGYDMFRRVGYVKTDGSSDILEFTQTGSGSDRIMTYAASIATDITNGSSATFAAVSLAASVPQASTEVLTKVTFTPTAADDPLELRSGDSSVDNGQAILSGSVAAVVTIGNLWVPSGATIASGIDYKVTGSAVAINVQGYVDQLGLLTATGN
jgi:hypothetical protein